ncbi:MAG: GNAT family N-acetyltransferase [Gemmatimonadota bacterium]|nr:MAG: GNAT family N-acetyltransferase [Gemmatimonadota bacterium]
MSVAIREARPDDADGLEELAFRARAEWGFEEAVRAADRAELIIPPRAVLEGRVFVAESEGRLHGFFALEPLGEGDIELTHLVIEPAEAGLGYGRRLWEQALIEAERLGGRRLVVVPDPGTEPFYVARGAEWIGESESVVRPGRTLPRLGYPLARPWPGKRPAE